MYRDALLFRGAVYREVQQNLPEDLMKSLNSLIQYNQGKFKSPAQAKFLYQKLQDFQDPTAESWGAEWLDRPNAMAVALVLHLKEFGRKTQSKVRYWGRLFVIDGAGVIAAAKADIQHVTKDSSMQLRGAKELIFQRQGDAPVLYDAEGEERARLEKAKQFDPLVQKIQALPEFAYNDFLKDIVYQLQGGYPLSPAQEKVLAGFLPYESEHKGTYREKYQRALDHLDKIVHAIDVANDEIQHNDNVTQRDKDAANSYIGSMAEEWNRWKSKPAYADEVGSGGLSTELFRAGWDKIAKRGWSLTLLWALGQVAQKGTKASKRATRLVREGEQFADWVVKVDPKQIAERLLGVYLARKW